MIREGERERKREVFAFNAARSTWVKLLDESEVLLSLWRIQTLLPFTPHVRDDVHRGLIIDGILTNRS